jgi:hypothetical protein
MFHVLGPLLENAKHVPAIIKMRQGAVQNNRRLCLVEGQHPLHDVIGPYLVGRIEFARFGGKPKGRTTTREGSGRKCKAWRLKKGAFCMKSYPTS